MHIVHNHSDRASDQALEAFLRQAQRRVQPALVAHRRENLRGTLAWLLVADRPDVGDPVPAPQEKCPLGA